MSQTRNTNLDLVTTHIDRYNNVCTQISKLHTC